MPVESPLLSSGDFSESPRVAHDELVNCVIGIGRIGALYQSMLSALMRPGTLTSEESDWHLSELRKRLQDEIDQIGVWQKLDTELANAELLHVAIGVRRVGIAARKAYRIFERGKSARHERLGRALAKLAGVHFDVAIFLQHLIEDRRELNFPVLNYEVFEKCVSDLAPLIQEPTDSRSLGIPFLMATAVLVAFVVYLIISFRLNG